MYIPPWLGFSIDCVLVSVRQLSREYADFRGVFLLSSRDAYSGIKHQRHTEYVDRGGQDFCNGLQIVNVKALRGYDALP